MNRLELCMSYDEFKIIDIGLARRSIVSAGENRVPAPENTENSIAIYGLMDSFDNEEGTQSETGGIHNAILMSFQNAYDSVEYHCGEISKRPNNASSNKRWFEQILNCQKVVRYGQFSRRGEIPHDFRSKTTLLKIK